MAVMAMAGRSTHCPLPQAILAASNQRQLTSIKDRILAGSEVIEEDSAGHVLWKTPKGRFWIPSGNDYVLPFKMTFTKQ